MTKSKPGGKTSHAIQLVQVADAECNSARTTKKGQTETAWIGAHPSLGNAVAKALLENGHITEAVLGDSKESITKIQAEVSCFCLGTLLLLGM